jgi:hypothetical protein
MALSAEVTHVPRQTINDDDDTKDPTAPFYETESFNSIWQGLQWRHVRTRLPVCWKKTARSRYMLANLVYLGYTIGILIINFDSDLNAAANETDSSLLNDTTSLATDGQSVGNVPLVNRLYIGRPPLGDIGSIGIEPSEHLCDCV